jgi:hypothetical protein
MLFSKPKNSKSAAQIFDDEIRAAYDRARDGGVSSYTICESLRSLADSEARRDAVSRPWSGHVPQQFDGYGLSDCEIANDDDDREATRPGPQLVRGQGLRLPKTDEEIAGRSRSHGQRRAGYVSARDRTTQIGHLET